MGEKWYVTHIFERENYLAKGPHGPNGEPTFCYQMMWEGQAHDVRDLLNKLEELLGAASCPCCDGSGGYYDNYGEATQCQWCYEKKGILNQGDQKSDSG